MNSDRKCGCIPTHTFDFSGKFVSVRGDWIMCDECQRKLDTIYRSGKVVVKREQTQSSEN